MKNSTVLSIFAICVIFTYAIDSSHVSRDSILISFSIFLSLSVICNQLEENGKTNKSLHKED